ncbi:hypothetical protein [Chitinophaga qingshengii]|uniref:Uncharacterized protein n=1 Tax=Chitinophaga qingshengii TaxID=1569794 RepID=A0ABR7TTE0_9BACT|nr:hypothetical protein [Chitinophaga qingshengii]MBC9932878.1 hypothetical protein [Chitinophaga qingshengii]
MSITTIVCSPHELKEELTLVMTEEFAVSQKNAESAYDGRLEEFFNRLKGSAQFVIEYPYVDKVYRDSYYSYFSSKLQQYQRNCIRVSVFDGSVAPDQFRNATGVADLRSRYWGFVIIRPTIPNVLGRSVVSPRALRENGFLCLTSKFQTTVCAVKFEAVGFPHASQDTETITCAETALWAMMEYFSSRYTEYKPLTASTIMNTLRNQSYFRQLPSEGLSIKQMSFALRELGFGTKSYLRTMYSSASFTNLLSIYIESGIPLILSISDRYIGGGIGHAVLAIGRTETTSDDIDRLVVSMEEDAVVAARMCEKNIRIVECADIEHRFVFIDDNYSAYQLASLEEPMVYYNNDSWRRCEIVEFLVPLYPKVYMDAMAARLYIKDVLMGERFNIPSDTELFIRVFLTSSRSYKDYLAIEDNFPGKFKEAILNLPMPKFIWVGEISSRVLMKQRMANGLVIVDVTEIQTSGDHALLAWGYGEYCYYKNGLVVKLVQNTIPLKMFNIFINNLKGF